jgi:hypothetical protein
MSMRSAGLYRFVDLYVQTNAPPKRRRLPTGRYYPEDQHWQLNRRENLKLAHGYIFSPDN